MRVGDSLVVKPGTVGARGFGARGIDRLHLARHAFEPLLCAATANFSFDRVWLFAMSACSDVLGALGHRAAAGPFAELLEPPYSQLVFTQVTCGRSVARRVTWADNQRRQQVGVATSGAKLRYPSLTLLAERCGHLALVVSFLTTTLTLRHQRTWPKRHGTQSAALMRTSVD